VAASLLSAVPGEQAASQIAAAAGAPAIAELSARTMTHRIQKRIV